MNKRRQVLSSSSSSSSSGGEEAPALPVVRPPAPRKDAAAPLPRASARERIKKRRLAESSSSSSSDDAPVCGDSTPDDGENASSSGSESPVPIVSDGSDEEEEEESDEEVEGFSHFELNMKLDKEKEEREASLARQLNKSSHTQSGKPSSQSDRRDDHSLLLAGPSVAKLPIREAFQLHLKYLLFSLADSSFPSKMRKSPLILLQTRIQRQVEEAMCVRRDRLVGSSMWAREITVGVLGRPWVELAGATASMEGYCDVCHRRGRTELTQVRVYGPKYDSAKLWSGADREWERGMPSPSECAKESEPVVFRSGNFCAWRLRLYSHLIHYKFKLLLTLSEYLEGHGGGSGADTFFTPLRRLVEPVAHFADDGAPRGEDGALAPLSDAKLLGIVSSKAWERIVKREFDTYTTLIEMADSAFAHSGSDFKKGPAAPVDAGFNWNHDAPRPVRFVQFVARKEGPLPSQPKSPKKLSHSPASDRRRRVVADEDEDGDGDGDDDEQEAVDPRMLVCTRLSQKAASSSSSSSESEEEVKAAEAPEANVRKSSRLQARAAAATSSSSDSDSSDSDSEDE